MKKVIILLTIALFAFSFKSADWYSYTNKKAKFTMEYPGDWVHVKKGRKTGYFFSPAEGKNDYREYIFVSALNFKTKGITIDQYADVSKKSIKERHGAEVNSSDKFFAGNNEGFTVMYDIKKGELKGKSAIESTIFTGKKVVFMTMVYEPEENEKENYVSTYKKMLKSIYFTK